MPLFATVKRNLYKDSVALMRISEQVLNKAGARRATLVMGTPANKEVLAEAKLLAPEVASAGPSDLIVVVDGESAEVIDAAQREIELLLSERGPSPAPGEAAHVPLRSIGMALSTQPALGATLAQISVPGPYAAAEAMKALKQGLHVFLFSDNVPVEQERALKQLASSKDLLVMGPDCGTAIIAGVPLGFANVVRRGLIGLVAASGTGLQEVSSQIHLLGGGVSHAIGTGGRDVSAEVGGITMLQALELLARDVATSVIVIISKPPAESVAQAVLARARAAGKPVVVLFLGSDMKTSGNIHAVRTLFDAAAKAVELVSSQPFAASGATAASAASSTFSFSAEQRYIRALFSGGTFCSEAQVIWREQGLAIYSNIPIDKSKKLADPRQSREHTAIDLGDDEFTVGRPHPMIDQSTRIDRLLAEARDASVAVILLDVVLGYGSHADPAGALAPAIREALALAAGAGRALAIVAFVCGTEEDPQCLSTQQERLRAAGALLAPSSTAAARLAARLIIQ